MPSQETVAVMSPLLLPLLLALGLGSLPGGWACSPPEGPYVPPNTETKIHFSDVVVYGKVLGTSPDKLFDSAYSALLDVYCVFKAKDNVPSQITIEGAGFVPGHCHSTNLTVNQEYVVYLGADGQRYESRFAETPVDKQVLDDFSFYCDVSIEYPDGVDLDPEGDKCPPNYPDYEECIAFKPTQSPPIPTPQDINPPAEPKPRTTPKTEIKIVSNTDGMPDQQGHAIQNNPAATEEDAKGNNPSESVAVAGYSGNGSDVPLVSLLLGAACLLVAVAARG